MASLEKDMKTFISYDYMRHQRIFSQCCTVQKKNINGLILKCKKSSISKEIKFL